MKNKILEFLSLWLPPIIWAGVIFKLSSGTVPQASSLYWPNFAFMKGAHLFFYGFLSVLIYRSLIGEGLSRKKAAIFAIIYTILYGVTDEIHQMFTQGREARVRDIVFDGLGASVAIILIYNFIPKFSKPIREIFYKFSIK